MPSFSEIDLILAALMFCGAALYTSVGHAGASAYIAIMGMFGVAAEVMRPTALALNIIVSGFSATRYALNKLTDWRVLWPFVAGAAPMAFIGGGIQLPGDVYKPLVGVVLWIAAARLLWPGAAIAAQPPRPVPVWAGVAIGAGIGLLSGLTGTGGGIFLSPILLFAGWAETRRASGTVAVFILANSVFGLAGNAASVRALPDALPLFAVAVFAGALVGTQFGIKLLPTKGIQRALAVVLVIAGAKLVGAF